MNDTQSLTNLYPVALEPAGDVKFTYESIPGLSKFVYIGGPARGGIETNNRFFAIFGNKFCEVYANGSFQVYGTLNTTTGPVSVSFGNFQVVVVDGPSGYVFRLSLNTFAQITDSDFYGSAVVRFMNNRFLFVRPDTGQFYWSEIDDATDLDALNFATAEVSPDNLVTLEVDHNEAYLLGRDGTEIWFAVDTDATFQRSQGSGMEVGCMAAQTVRQIDNSIFWLGRDRTGSCIVYKAEGHQPLRISTHEVETDLQASSDPSQAVAYVYQDKGLTFYAINAPGMAKTWVFEASTKQWAKRCDLDDFGNFKARRTTTALFAFDTHLSGADDGYLYALSEDVYQDGGDPLVRELITPREFDPDGRQLIYNEFVGRFRCGEAAQGTDPQVELSWSDDGGKTWSNPVARSLGLTGEYFSTVMWNRVGGDTRDRAWKIRCSANAPFSIRNYKSRYKVGTN